MEKEQIARPCSSDDSQADFSLVAKMKVPIFRHGGFWVFRYPGTLVFSYHLTRAQARAARKEILPGKGLVLQNPPLS